MGSAVALEEVGGGKALVRFAELPAVLWGDDPRFPWPVQAWERYRLDPRRQPYFERGDGTYLLARRGGRPVGRIAAHLPARGGEGRFGFWACADGDDGAAAALLDGAARWLQDQGAAVMAGPLSFTPDDEPGVLVDGFDVPGTTGRPWHPPSQAALLDAHGLVPADEQRTWRLPVTTDGPVPAPAGVAPGQAGRHHDPRLVLDGIAAVPDVSGALRTAGLRGAWALAGRARRHEWSVATVVRLDGDPAVVVPRLQRAAGAAGYEAVIAPWSPDPSAPPETVHRRYRRDL